MVVGVGFEPTNARSGRIYSPHPLATWIPYQLRKGEIVREILGLARPLSRQKKIFQGLLESDSLAMITSMCPFPGKSVVGLTGGIACGKSAALEIFLKNGWEAISTDQLAAEILATDQTVREQLLGRWKNEVFDERGIVDKRRIAEIVFNETRERSWLEGVLHPLIREAWREKIESTDQSLFVVEIPLLFENDLQSHFVRTISLFASRELQHQRLLERGLSDHQANARIDSQMAPERKAELADVVLLGSGSLEFLERQVLLFLNAFSEKQPQP